MKQIVLALAAVLLMAATSVHAQQAPAATQPQADVATATPAATQTCRDSEGRQVPCPPRVEKVARNNTPIILGAVGAAALVGAAAGGGGGGSGSDSNPTPSPSLPSSP
jgi:hypothetical protein